MKRLTHAIAIVASLGVSAMGLVAGAPAAFAVPMGDPVAGPVSVNASPVTTTGMASWEVVLVALAAALFAVAITAGILLRTRLGLILRSSSS